MPRPAGWKTIECPVCHAPPGAHCLDGDIHRPELGVQRNGVDIRRRNSSGNLAQHPERGEAAWKRDYDAGEIEPRPAIPGHGEE